ncbi:hypothetical protein CFP56_002324 [Quercus suber]|uniref:Secreted protein n=1 Tax=Quercus suber TaxID=58331 RepID=A0AAW0ILL6_QUESU
MKYAQEWCGWTSNPVRGTLACSLWWSIGAGWDRFHPCVSIEVEDIAQVRCSREHHNPSRLRQFSSDRTYKAFLTNIPKRRSRCSAP